MIDNRKGLTNGINNSNNINSYRGLVNGEGKGLVNGEGKGLVNGLKSNEKININKKAYEKRQKNIMPILIIILMLILSMIIIKPYINEDSTIIKIDGDFDKWDNHELQDIGFAQFGMQKGDNGRTIIALKQENILLGTGNITESYIIFINDKNSSNGFYIGYDSYEYYIDIYGKGNKIYGATGYQFDETRNNTDWNGFTSKYTSFPVRKANNESIIEFELSSIELGKKDMNNLELLIYHFDTEGNYEYSKVIEMKGENIERIKNTKSANHFYYEQILENNELHIYTEKSLAYTPIPYEIRVIKEITKDTTILNTETDINNQNITYKEPELLISNVGERKRGTKLIIYYNSWRKVDIINQCGGVILFSTVNVTLDDVGYHIYQINKEIRSIKIEGDFNYIIENYGTRTGGLSYSIMPESMESDNEQPLGTINSMNATYFDGSITIDGVLNESAWNDYADTYIVNLTADIKIYTMHNNEYTYIGIKLLDDTTESQEELRVYFDTNHNASSNPDTADKMIYYNESGVIKYYEGDGTNWVETTIPTGWDISKSTTNTLVSFELQVTNTELNQSGNYSKDGDIIGFGIYVKDPISETEAHHIFYPDAYSYGTDPTTLYWDDPNTWNDLILDIPEFKNATILFITLFFMIIFVFIPKRRRLNNEQY